MEQTLFLINLDKVFDFYLSKILTKSNLDWIDVESVFPLLLQNYQRVVSVHEIPKEVKKQIKNCKDVDGHVLDVVVVTKPQEFQPSAQSLVSCSESRTERLGEIINLAEEECAILLALDGYFNLLNAGGRENQKDFKAMYLSIKPKLVQVYKDFAKSIYGCSDSVMDHFIGMTIDNLQKSTIAEIPLFRSSDSHMSDDDLDIDLGGPDYLPLVAASLVNLMLPTILQSSVCYRDSNGLLVIGLRPLLTETEFKQYESTLDDLGYTKVAILKNSWTLIANK